MKKLNTAHKLFILATSALLLNFGCAREDNRAAESAEWQQPEDIKVEISLKDERKGSVDKSVEEAPALAGAHPSQSNTCAPQTSAYGQNPQWAGQGQNPASPWSQGLGNRGAWGQGLQQGGAPWGQNGASAWPQAGQNPASAWPTSANTAPQSADLAPGLGALDACVPPVGGAPYGAPGYPGLGYPGLGYPAPVLPGFPALPFFDPYAPYYVADVVVRSDDDSFQNDDDSQIDDDDDISEDDVQ